MDAHVKDVVREMSKASDEERITFPGGGEGADGG